MEGGRHSSFRSSNQIWSGRYLVIPVIVIGYSIRLVDDFDNVPIDPSDSGDDLRSFHEVNTEEARGRGSRAILKWRYRRKGINLRVEEAAEQRWVGDLRIIDRVIKKAREEKYFRVKIRRRRSVLRPLSCITPDYRIGASKG